MKGKSGERTRRKQKVAVDRVDDWLREQPLQWSTVIAVRAALRALPLGVNTRGDRALSTFRAAAIAQFSAKHPNRAIDSSYVRLAMAAYGCADQEKNSGLLAVAIAAKTAAEVALTRSKPADDRILLGAPYLSASAAIGAATHAANDAQEFLNALSHRVYGHSGPPALG
jgi:hypothetical protein